MSLSVLFTKLNKFDNESFTYIVQYCLSHHTQSISDISSINQIILNSLPYDSPEILILEVISLIKTVFYNRFSNKFKNEMMNSGINSQKSEIFYDLCLKNKENLMKLDETCAFYDGNEYKKLSNIEITTNMPVFNSNNQGKIDNKQQYFNLSLDFEGDFKSVRMDKSMGSRFFQEIEKIQEALDRLY